MTRGKPMPCGDRLSSGVTNQLPIRGGSVGDHGPSAIHLHGGEDIQVLTAHLGPTWMVVSKTKDRQIHPKILIINPAKWRPTRAKLTRQITNGPRNAPVLRRLVNCDAILGSIPARPARIHVAGVHRTWQRNQRLESRKHQVVWNDGRVRQNDGYPFMLPRPRRYREVDIAFQLGQFGVQVVGPGSRRACHDQGAQRPHEP